MTVIVAICGTQSKRYRVISCMGVSTATISLRIFSPCMCTCVIFYRSSGLLPCITTSLAVVKSWQRWIIWHSNLKQQPNGISIGLTLEWHLKHVLDTASPTINTPISTTSSTLSMLFGTCKLWTVPMSSIWIISEFASLDRYLVDWNRYLVIDLYIIINTPLVSWPFTEFVRSMNYIHKSLMFMVTRSPFLPR